MGVGISFDISIINGEVRISRESETTSGRQYKGKYTRALPTEYVLIDVESTGLSPYYDDILEVAAVRVRNNLVVDSFSKLVKNEDFFVPRFVTSMTGITMQMIEELGETPATVVAEFLDFVKDDLIVGYNTSFDINFLYDAALNELGRYFRNDYIDVMQFAKKIEKGSPRHRLVDMISLYNLEHQSHRALADCFSTKEVYDIITNKMADSNVAISDIFKKARARKKAHEFSVTVDEIDEDNPVFGKNICFTGTMDLFRDDLFQLVTNLGATPSRGVTRKTNFLVVGDFTYNANVKGNKTNKLKKSEDLFSSGQDILIIPESVFMEMIVDYLDE